jgi:peroxin-4
LDLLKESWSAVSTISNTLTSIQQLLMSPEADSPLNVDAAAIIRTGDEVGYESLVRVWSVLHAGKPPTFG